MAKEKSAAVATAEVEATFKAAFDRFMSQPTTKLMFSMVPPTEPPELLATLVRSAFETGATIGFTTSMSMMTEELVRSIKGREL